MNQGKIIHFLLHDQVDKAFRSLYSYYPKVEKYILINSGSKEEALDVFQDALVVLYEKVQTLEADTEIKIDGFLINTCKFIWLNELRKKKVRISDEEKLDQLGYENEINEQLQKEEKYQIIDAVIQQLGNKCRSILELFYFRAFSMEAIAKKFGYKTVKSAKVQKYKCMENARKLALEMSNQKQPLS
ncbi:MAG: sigma-70 family RNA polymerase sigma factor [Crocinitomicaceae bacterium]|nr:sigma-70 family RNA polymerase sigma factor [Crocinitomicaceae bacterium]